MKKDYIKDLEDTARTLGEMESTLNTADYENPGELSKLAQAVSAISRLRVDVLCRLIEYEKLIVDTQSTSVARFPTMHFLNDHQETG